MIRLLLRLFRIRDFEPCASCSILKAELEYARHEKRELLDTIINLTKPNVVIPTGETKVLVQAPQASGTFSRRRAILEEQHKVKGDVIKNSTLLARPDDFVDLKKEPTKHITPASISKIEQELGLGDEEGKNA